MGDQDRSFAALLSLAAADQAPKRKEAQTAAGQRACDPAGEVRVTGVAEETAAADRATVTVSVDCVKDSVAEVTSSVSRRLDYVLQTLRQHGVKDEDVSVRRHLCRDYMFRMDTQTVVDFSDFEVMEKVICVLLEKLDSSVYVTAPKFYHSAECTSKLRCKAFSSAVENAKQKVTEVSRLLGETVGHPLLVSEEETRESMSSEEDGDTSVQVPHRPVATISSRVSVSFALPNQTRKRF